MNTQLVRCFHEPAVMALSITRALKVLAIFVCLFPGISNAATVNLDFSWTGINSYTVQGSFSYNDSLGFGPIIDETELSSFSATAFTPTSVALKTYDLTNQNASFNFNYDTGSSMILQSGNAFVNDGFFIGQLLNTSGEWLFSTFVGCGAPAGISLRQIDGGCNGLLFDQDGTAFTVTSAVPLPAGAWLFGSGLGMLGWIMRRQIA